MLYLSNCQTKWLELQKSNFSNIAVPLLQPSIINGSKINGSCMQTFLFFFYIWWGVSHVIWIVKKGSDFELCLTYVRPLSVGHMIESSLLIIVFTCWKSGIKDTWIFVNQAKGPGDHSFFIIIIIICCLFSIFLFKTIITVLKETNTWHCILLLSKVSIKNLPTAISGSLSVPNNVMT